MHAVALLSLHLQKEGRRLRKEEKSMLGSERMEVEEGWKERERRLVREGRRRM